MSTTALTKLLDLLTSTLSTSDMAWLIEEMKGYLNGKEENLKPYTKEELHARIALSERDSAEGRVYDFDDVMREIEDEFAYEEELDDMLMNIQTRYNMQTARKDSRIAQWLSNIPRVAALW